MKIRLCILAFVTAFLGLWGIEWCLPEASRIARVLPPGVDTPQFRERLQSSWQKLHQRLGENILLHPEAYSYGFDRTAVVSPGWKQPPEQLLNSARSFYLRSGHEDESDILFALSQIKPWRLEFNPHIYFYGGTYLYSLGAWIAVSSVFTPAQLTGDVGFYLSRTDQIAWLYLLGRLFSVAAYAAGVWILYVLGKRFFSAQAGLIAAALYAAAPGIVLQTHYMKPHLLGTFFALCAFYFCAELLYHAKKSGWICAGAAVGLAAGCSIPFWSSAWIVCATFFFRIKQGGLWKNEFQGAALSGLAALTAYALANPFLLAEFPLFWKGTRAVSGFASPGFSSLTSFILAGMPLALTWPVCLCLWAGLFRKENLNNPVRTLAVVSFLGLLLTSWIYPNTSRTDGIRYFAGTGIGFLLAGSWFVELGPRLVNLFLLPVLYAGMHGLLLDYNLHLDSTDRSTRHAAGTWIEQTIPAGFELGLTRLPQPSNAPYFQWNRYRLKFIQPQVLAADATPDSELPRYLIVTSPSYDDRPLLRPLLDKHYSLARVFPQKSWGPIALKSGDIGGNPLIEIYKRR